MPQLAVAIVAAELGTAAFAGTALAAYGATIGVFAGSAHGSVQFAKVAEPIAQGTEAAGDTDDDSEHRDN